MVETENKAPAYPWYARDFAADEPVQLMTLEEEGAYRRLLDHQWLHGSIPCDVVAIARICKNTPRARMVKLWAAIAPCFVADDSAPSRLQNRRLERERARSAAYRERQSAAGKLGAEAAWGDGEAGDGKRYTYAMVRESDGAIKIGVSRSPERRAQYLSSKLKTPITLIAYGEGGFTLERAAQVELSSDRIGTEWFRDTPQVRGWIGNHLVSPSQSQGNPLVVAKAEPSLAVCSLQFASAPALNQSSSGREMLADVMRKIPAEYHADIGALLDRVPSPITWLAELSAGLNGMDGHRAVTGPQAGEASRDFNANGAEPNLRRFRAFLQRAKEPPSPAVSKRPSNASRFAPPSDTTKAIIADMLAGKC
ncbi:MAG TPA: DUF1376 domain-containing protein [Gemmatimonadaceae bacterium]